MIVNESIKINESKSFNKGDKIKFLHPATLDQWIKGTINREANSKEINKTYDHPTNDKYYLIDVMFNGKKDQIVIASQDIKNESINESKSFSKGDKVKIYATLDRTWLPGYEIVKEVSDSELNKYHASSLVGFKDKKYLVKCIRDGLFKNDLSVELEKNIKNESINESAKDAIVLDKNSKHIVASQINLNLVGEYDALDGYQKLIPWFEKYNDQESIAIIREISSDEKNHAELLRKILLKYDGNIPTAKD